MGAGNVTDEFKIGALAQITGRGYPINDFSDRLGVSLHSHYAWKRKFAKSATGETEKDVDIRRLKRELAQVSDLSGARKQSGRPFPRRIGTF